MSTHTYDAVDDAIRMLFVMRHSPLDIRQLSERRGDHRRFPVGDTVSPNTVIERANGADTSVYVVTMPSYTRLLASRK